MVLIKLITHNLIETFSYTVNFLTTSHIQLLNYFSYTISFLTTSHIQLF